MPGISEALKFTLKNLPDLPGVYQFFDKEDQILYVGKSKSLRKRVNSYFDRESPYPRVRKLVSLIVRIEFFVTSSETEALILEANLIKTISPRYNILFKDDKSYPYVRLTIKTKWPWVEKTRIKKEDGSLYFGPFTNGTYVYRLLQFLDKNYSLVKCATDVNRIPKKSCLEYQIGRCPAPCELLISEEAYQEQVQEVRQILEGRIHKVSQKLEILMKEAAADLLFEKALEYRDQINSLKMLTVNQNAEEVSSRNEDYFAISVSGDYFLIQHLLVREGRIVEQKKQMGSVEDFSPLELMMECISQRLMLISDPPARVCLSEELVNQDEMIALILAISREKQVKIELFHPKIGRMRRLMDMTEKNAFESLRIELLKEDKSASLLLEARDSLGLYSIPYRIECFDISNIQGTNPVASMVVCIDGHMQKSEYRRFAIKGKNTPDDFAMMREAVTRRYTRLQKEDGVMPDLLLIDGGLGQLHAAAEALRELGLNLQVSSLAKREELIYVLGQEDHPVQLGKFSSVRLLFQKIRDEAHRFAITYHKLLRSKRTLHSILEEVPGIGPVTRKKLLKACPDLEVMTKMTVEQIKEFGISEKVALALLEKLNSSLFLHT